MYEKYILSYHIPSYPILSTSPMPSSIPYMLPLRH